MKRLLTPFTLIADSVWYPSLYVLYLLVRDDRWCARIARVGWDDGLTWALWNR